MNLFEILLLADLLSVAILSDFCPRDLCPPIWQRVVDHSDRFRSVFVGRDEESGCECMMISGNYSVCYGRATCRSFPRKVNITTENFEVKATQIPDLKPGDLVNFTHLRVLRIEGNFNLTRISTGTFLKMTELKTLSVSYNANLKSVERGSFDGLLSLTELILVKNAFSKLATLTSSLARIPKLHKLELSENKFLKIEREDFEPMRDVPLTELNLILCQIEAIEPQAFNPLKNLTVLRLGENNLSGITIARTIEEAVRHLPLRSLNLYSVGLRSSTSKPLLNVIAKSNITTLVLAKNQFEVITGETFPSMPNLQLLDLRQVLNLNITNDAFVGLTHLRTLFLGGNKLFSIPEGVLLEQLKYLDLQKNSDNTVSSSYFSIFGKRFINMKNLQFLDLSHNAVQIVYNTSFEGLNSLRVLRLKNANIYSIHNGSFSMLSALVSLNLEDNGFIGDHPYQLTSSLFEGLENLQILRLGGCRISQISLDTFQELKNLKHLCLERNNLVNLPSLQVLPNLEILDVSQNFLKPWEKRIFKGNPLLKDVTANDNRLSLLTEKMLEDFGKLKKLKLEGNPFTCDCSLSWYTAEIATLVKNQTILCAYNSSSLLEFLQHRKCINFALILPLAFFIVLVTTTTFLVYYFRTNLSYWVFLIRLHLSQGKERNRVAPVTFTYDAFVSYSSEDRNFVVRLVSMLENHPPFVKLCVYERDFEVGAFISENIIENLTRSRKTLLVVSDSYARSQWCRWESHLVEHHKLFLSKLDDSLILIKLGPVNDNHLSPTLKYLLNSRIYLQWESDEKKQKVFWEKLRGTLAPLVEINENTHI